MPYSFSLSDPVYRDIAGRRHVSVDVTESDVGPTDEWSLPIHEFATLTLVHCVLDTPGSATEVDPECGVAASWSTDDINHLVSNATASVAVRIQDRVHVVARNGTLFGRSKPDATADTVVTRVAWVEGHDE